MGIVEYWNHHIGHVLLQGPHEIRSVFNVYFIFESIYVS